MASSSLITFRTSSVTSIYLILLLFWSILPIVLAKSCKKIDKCKCEMSDGSGTISLWDLDNSDGKPRFQNIPAADQDSSSYTFLFNPCTPLKFTSGKEKDCSGSNLCQKLNGKDVAYYPCDESEPTFAVDNSGQVVMTYKIKYFQTHFRYSNITLICDKEEKTGSFGKGVMEIVISSGKDGKSEYAATLSAKAACPVSSSLSIGSIILIVFFPLVLLYLIIGILFNIYVRHQKSVPEVLPNYTFWADFPFLVKDGCVFSCGKMKYCCHSLVKKARGEEYTKI